MAIYLKIILVVHLMVSANSLAVHFIDSAPYGSLSTYLIFGQAIRCTIIYFLVTIGQLMIFAQPPHYYAILSWPSTTSRKWENAEKVAKMGILIRDLQWGNGDPYTWSGIFKNSRISSFSGDMRKYRFSGLWWGNLKIEIENHHTYVYIIIDLSLIPLIGGVKYNSRGVEWYQLYHKNRYTPTHI